MGSLSPSHKPDYSKTEPPVSIPPQPSWSDPSKIVSFDPWGHLVQGLFADEEVQGVKGLDIRPSIAVTKAHLKMSELDEAARRGEIEVDGKIVLKSRAPLGVDEATYNGIEVNVSKAAVEPVWYLPGVAERFEMCVLVCAGLSDESDIAMQIGNFASSRPVRRYRRDVPRTDHTP